MDKEPMGKMSQNSHLELKRIFADCLQDMGFSPSKAKPDIWMKHCGDHYEYVATYIDDIFIAATEPGTCYRNRQTRRPTSSVSPNHKTSLIKG